MRSSLSSLPHSSCFHCGGLRRGVVLRLVLLWFAILSSIFTLYLLFIPAAPSRLTLPDPIEIFYRPMHQNTNGTHKKSMLDIMQKELLLRKREVEVGQGNGINVTATTAEKVVKGDNNDNDNDLMKEKVRRKEGSRSSRFAYVTLLHGIDDSFAYRGFLYHVIVMREALRRLGSTADFIAMIGFSSPNQATQPSSVSDLIRRDLELLRRHDILLHFLPRLHTPLSLAEHFSSLSLNPSLLESLSRRFEQQKVNFLEMALLKIAAFNFTRYEKIQYMDGDVLPHENMDCFFQLTRNSFNTGSASPLNSGWFLAIANASDFARLQRLSVLRFARKWDEVNGWGDRLPSDIFYRGQQRRVKKWEFNGASLDQGLFTHYFALHEGRVQLFDTADVIQFDKDYQKTVLSEGLREVVDSICPPPQKRGRGRDSGRGRSPMDFFFHFTGRNKPWLQNLSKPKDGSVRQWISIFDSLNLSVNSTSLRSDALKPPLGFFHPNK